VSWRRVPVTWWTWSVRVEAFDPDLEPLPIPFREKESDGPADIGTGPAPGDALRPGTLKDRPQVGACRNLRGGQGAAVLITSHQPGPARDRL